MNTENNILPTWNLEDLYGSADSKELLDDFSTLEISTNKFINTYQNSIANISSENFSEAILLYENLKEKMEKISSFAELLYNEDLLNKKNSRFAQSVREKISSIVGKLIFFTLEINNLSEKTLQEHYKNETLKRYRPWIETIRLFKDYQLSKEIEKVFEEKKITSSSAWKRLYDETIAGLSFRIEEDNLSLDEALEKLSSPDRKVRVLAGLNISSELQKKVDLFALITNNLIKDKEIEDRWRKYPEVDTFRHLSNNIEPRVVESLVKSVKETFPLTSHRYYKLKAKRLALKNLEFWDRNAPFGNIDEKIWTWEEAAYLVLSAFKEFSPELATIGSRFFENQWIDALPRTGKSSGAFAHPTVPSVHPYLLLNFQGKTNDVMTLAHELGHGIHQILASSQGMLISETPLIMAETASVFGEQLTFRKLLKSVKGKAAKQSLLASKIEDMLNTIIRQVSFYEFERLLHHERRSGEISQERIGELWMSVQAESLGPAFKLAAEYRYFWTYVPHFVHEPFYVYAYAFGDCLVNSLYKLYLEGIENFEEKYIGLLKSGGSLKYSQLISTFGLDASSPGFWKSGLNVIENLIDELAAVELEG